ncbi:uncharacterized protein GGS22DRAFT_189819 [Annulohypoxylon maeteangense]|uniref:uncharacterized protein n=1 Tax=Annulohypoxylon maeteangense TaxID=1927788 RepID=UPI0020082AC9|nr:uncharacterized protein GGS22DRAFT_189819 [Annulohypoxylon maeteangense]KAI0883848.1 hypothetical protein GGS22DRAFT_189819 [Annulohypoxylon maeteangense]
MTPVKILLARVLFANLLRFAVGMDNSTIPKPSVGPPVDSMFVTQCLDTRCLCNQKDYQKSLFQCLYSQCDSNHYGPALSHAISLCMSLGAEIYMVAPVTVDNELLRSREDDYLAGREVANLPGMQLRQESIAFGETTTVTTMVTAIVTVSYSPTTISPTPTAFLETTSLAVVSTTSVSRPWIIPVSRALRMEPSYFGLVVWVCVVVIMDYWVNGYWG